MAFAVPLLTVLFILVILARGSNVLAELDCYFFVGESKPMGVLRGFFFLGGLIKGSWVEA